DRPERLKMARLRVRQADLFQRQQQARHAGDGVDALCAVLPRFRASMLRLAVTRQAVAQQPAMSERDLMPAVGINRAFCRQQTFAREVVDAKLASRARFLVWHTD